MLSLLYINPPTRHRVQLITLQAEPFRGKIKDTVASLSIRKTESAISTADGSTIQLNLTPVALYFSSIVCDFTAKLQMMSVNTTSKMYHDGQWILLFYWCAILIAHQLLWQNMEGPVSIFQESPLVGKPRERLFHIHSIHRYLPCTKYFYPSTLYLCDK